MAQKAKLRPLFIPKCLWEGGCDKSATKQLVVSGFVDVGVYCDDHADAGKAAYNARQWEEKQ